MYPKVHSAAVNAISLLAARTWVALLFFNFFFPARIQVAKIMHLVAFWEQISQSPQYSTYARRDAEQHIPSPRFPVLAALSFPTQIT